MYERRIVTDGIDESLINHYSYKEGVVELFNRFYLEAQRRYGEDLSCLTARELQQMMLEKMPEGAYPLDDLVTAFEAANYSTAEPLREDFERCRAAVDVLFCFMDDTSIAEKPRKMHEDDTAGKSLEETSINSSSLEEKRRDNHTNLLRGVLCFSVLCIILVLLYFTKIEFKSYIEECLQIILLKISRVKLGGS